MTHPTSTHGIVSKAQLTELTIEALCALGLNRADATDTATILVLADLFGLRTHGTSRIESYGSRLRIGGINPTPSITAQQVGPALHRLDGEQRHRSARRLSRARSGDDGGAQTRHRVRVRSGQQSFRPGVASIRTSPPGRGFAEHHRHGECDDDHRAAGGHRCAPRNSPVGFGVPDSGWPSVHSGHGDQRCGRGQRIRNALKRGEPIPSDWATDAQGKPTTDPKAALDGFLPPIGGHKGYGLALVVDLFAGLLSGAAYLTHVKSSGRRPRATQKSSATSSS